VLIDKYNRRIISLNVERKSEFTACKFIETNGNQYLSSRVRHCLPQLVAHCLFESEIGPKLIRQMRNNEESERSTESYADYASHRRRLLTIAIARVWKIPFIDCLRSRQTTREYEVIHEFFLDDCVNPNRTIFLIESFLMTFTDNNKALLRQILSDQLERKWEWNIAWTSCARIISLFHPLPR